MFRAEKFILGIQATSAWLQGFLEKIMYAPINTPSYHKACHNFGKQGHIFGKRDHISGKPVTFS